MKKHLLLSCLVLAFATSCISTKNTIKNIDDKAPAPMLSKDKVFIITEVATNDKYGYDPDYPINLGFLPIQTAEVNVHRYFGGITGPNGEQVSYEKMDSCCPFPSEKNSMGAGILDIYQVTWPGQKQPKRLYINLYERGRVMAPKGMGVKQQ